MDDLIEFVLLAAGAFVVVIAITNWQKCSTGMQVVDGQGNVVRDVYGNTLMPNSPCAQTPVVAGAGGACDLAEVTRRPDPLCLINPFAGVSF